MNGPLSAPGGAAGNGVPKRPRWRRGLAWVTGTLLVLNLVFALVVAALVWYGAEVLAGEGVRVIVDGRPWSLEGWGQEHFLVLAVAAFVVGLVLMLVVPLSLGVALIGVLIGSVAAFAATALALAVATAPLWIPGLLIVWLVRRRGAPRAATNAP